MPFYEIIGVVKDTKYVDLHDDFEPIAYFPDLQEKKPDPGDQILVRSNSPLGGLISDLKDTFAKVNPLIDIDFHTFRSTIEGSLIRDRLMATLSGFFGILAGVLAAIGLYGVISYSVARRRNEIGIRMALGAEGRDVLGLVLRMGLRLVAIGVGIGLIASLALGRVIATQLWGVSAYDPWTLTCVPGLLIVIALLACWVPAHRAAGVDPLVALRYE